MTLTFDLWHLNINSYWVHVILYISAKFHRDRLRNGRETAKEPHVVKINNFTKMSYWITLILGRRTDTMKNNLPVNSLRDLLRNKRLIIGCTNRKYNFTIAISPKNLDLRTLKSRGFVYRPIDNTGKVGSRSNKKRQRNQLLRIFLFCLLVTLTFTVRSWKLIGLLFYLVAIHQPSFK